ncbi:putative dihydroorotate dehydrogenase A (fumarate) [Lachnellula subtilissima]|uniref:Putative dihydroorotate dehydrogenase A (Fumarate) n=1 Tax=Lachnellula subtilissima TaxID=602034 RepID=A0A8H8RZP6_9HELO|nr:putative dihydroorotate dehydrogenase A (fumarate) [Lachnellula subtilissima]
MSSPPLLPFKIHPPLLNSSNPWATTEADLSALYACPYTGAVTIRTSLCVGHATARIDTSGAEGRGEVREGEGNSLNTLGYSPIPFESYIGMLIRMNEAGILNNATPKPFIVSVTGTAEEVGRCMQCPYKFSFLCISCYVKSYIYMAKTLHERKTEGLQLMMEINLSCPNIPDKPPPAYDSRSLAKYILAIRKAKSLAESSRHPCLHVGIKTPPYTYPGQFHGLISALEEGSASEKPGSSSCPISFITATNTLGSCLVLRDDGTAALGSVGGLGIGGMAGEALHALALGNVKTIRGMLDASAYAEIRGMGIIGIGGVSDAAGFARMRSVGAAAVGVGTAFGREGIEVFGKITAGVEL